MLEYYKYIVYNMLHITIIQVNKLNHVTESTMLRKLQVHSENHVTILKVRTKINNIKST